MLCRCDRARSCGKVCLWLVLFFPFSGKSNFQWIFFAFLPEKIPWLDPEENIMVTGRGAKESIKLTNLAAFFFFWNYGENILGKNGKEEKRLKIIIVIICEVEKGLIM